MTKNKKKMAKSTIAIIVMAVVLVAMLAFGGTYAYFTASTTTKTDTVQTGVVKLEKNTMATLVSADVVSGQELLSAGSKVAVTNASNVDTWIFVTFTATFTKADGVTVTPSQKATLAECKAEGDFALVLTQDSKWVAVDATNHPGVFAYKSTKVGDPAAYETDIDVCTGIKFYGVSKSVQTDDAAAVQGSLMGATITVTIGSEAIQVLSEADGTTELTAAQAYAVLHPATPGP